MLHIDHHKANMDFIVNCKLIFIFHTVIIIIFLINFQEACKHFLKFKLNFINNGRNNSGTRMHDQLFGILCEVKH